MTEALIDGTMNIWFSAAFRAEQRGGGSGARYAAGDRSARLCGCDSRYWVCGSY